MADAILRIAGRDYSRYLKLYSEDQVGVVDAERVAPQFAGVAALSEGAVWIGDAVSNKHWQVQTIIRGSAEVGLYPGDAWTTSDPAFLNAGAVYTPATGQVVANGAAAAEGVEISLGTLPAGTYRFTILLRGNAGGEALALYGGQTAAPSSANITLSAQEAPYTLQFTTDGTGVCWAVVRREAASAATWFLGNGVVREQAITVDRANQLVAQIQQELVKGATVEYRPDGASLSTFFDLETGEFRPNYNHPRYKKGYVEGMLELFTRPYGHTGTTRLIASAAASMPGMLYATGVLGDVDAAAVVTISPQATVAPPYAAGLGVKYPVGSFSPFRIAASLTSVATGGTLIGATWAPASQYLAWPFAATGGIAATNLYQLVSDSPPGTGEWAGRYRVLALVRNGFANASNAAAIQGTLVLAARDENLAVTGVGVATGAAGGSAFHIVDLGERTLGPSYPFPQVNIWAAAPGAGASLIATMSVALAGLFYLPLDRTAGMLVSDYATGATDTFRFEGQSGLAVAQTNASGVVGDRTAKYRGVPPRIPPCGSPAASGPIGVAYISGSPKDFFGANSGYGTPSAKVSVSVRERFSFFRGA